MQFSKLVAQCNLGKMKNKPQKLLGGALHSMYKISTSKGEFAIKCINPHIVAKPNFVNNYELSEMIAERFKVVQIPAVSAIRQNNKFIIYLDEQAYLIYPFIKGKLLTEEELKSEHAQQIGEIYALMHSMQIVVPGVDKAHYDFFSNEYWESLVKKTNIAELTNLLPAILAWNEIFERSISTLGLESVVTHRDMHSKNVLWDTNNNPHIIDWESAGLMNPLMEIIGYGLEWSGVLLNGSINFEIFNAFTTSYFNKLTVNFKTTIDQAFYGWLGHCVLAWTEFNLRRLLGEISSNIDEIDLGKKIIIDKMIPCLQFISENEDLIKDGIYQVVMKK